MTATDDYEVLDTLMRNRIRWSRAADAMKRRLDRTRMAALVLSATGTIAATLTATWLRPGQTDVGVVVGMVGALALSSAAFLTTQYLNPAATRRWARTRAVSEGSKALIFRFRAGVQPFTGGDAVTKLQSELAEIEDTATDLMGDLPMEQTTAAFEPPSPLTPEDYIRIRVEHQMKDYYRPKARQYRVLARRLRIAEFAFLGTAAAVSVVNTAKPEYGLGPWVAVLTSLAGSLAAHHAARRYEFLVDSYTATANRLERKMQRWRADGAPTDEDKWSRFVDDCEAVIAAENQAWVVKWADSR